MHDYVNSLYNNSLGVLFAFAPFDLKPSLAHMRCNMCLWSMHRVQWYHGRQQLPAMLLCTFTAITTSQAMTAISASLTYHEIHAVCWTSSSATLSMTAISEISALCNVNTLHAMSAPKQYGKSRMGCNACNYNGLFEFHCASAVRVAVLFGNTCIPFCSQRSIFFACV